MIDNKELHKRLQTESYRIICESISEEERKSMSLKEEEIIPTINIFRKIQIELIEYLWTNDACLDYEESIEYEVLDYDLPISKLEGINITFLKLLCESVGIKCVEGSAYNPKDDELRFFWKNKCLKDDVKRKYLI